MRTTRSRLTLRHGLLVLLLSAGGLVATAFAQDDQEPPFDGAVDDQQDDQEPPFDGAIDDQQSDQEQPPDDSAVADDSDSDETVFLTEDWAADVVVDESDDAVQTDRELDPTGEPWAVVEPDAAGISSVPDWARPARRTKGDYVGKSEILPVGPTGRRAATPQKQGKDTPYSYSGKPVAPGTTPWKAQIYASKYSEPGVPVWVAQHHCGGALIVDKEWVLTAAHCIDNLKAAPGLGWRVRLGAHDIAKGDGVTYAIDRWVRHSGYRQPTKAEIDRGDPPGPPPNMYMNDIALVHIMADEQTRPLGDPKLIQSIQLYRGPVSKDAEVTALGWGMTQKTVGSFSATPLKVELQVMDTGTCQNLKGYGPSRINTTVMCAAREKQRTCKGDSGGPIILTNNRPAQLVGLVSWGKSGCTGDGEPSVFTRVQSQLVWIDKAMKLEPTRSSLP